MRERRPSIAVGCIVAVVATAIIAALRFSVRDRLGDVATFLPFVVSVMVAAWYGGLLPGLFATALGGATSVYLFVGPAFSFQMENSEAAGLMVFLVTGATVTWLCEQFHRVRRRVLESENRFRSLMSATTSIIWTTDPSGRFATPQPSWAEYTGQRWEQHRDFGWIDALHSEDRQRGRETWEAACAARGQYRFDGRLWNAASGAYRRIESRGVPILDLDGAVREWVGKCLDVEDRKRAEDRVLAATEQLQIVTDSMSALVTLCSRDLRYLWVSKSCSDWLGLSPEEVVGRPIADVLGAEAFETLRPQFERVLAGDVVRYEAQVNYHRLGRRWIQAIYTPTRDTRGAPDGWVAVLTDISDRKRNEQALEEADRRKNEFLATLAHELRNPLAPMRSALEILRLARGDEAAAEESRAVMERQLGRMVRLVDDLLDVGRITRGRLELRKERVELATIVRSAVETIRPLLEASAHELSVTLPPESVPLDADPTRLTQVFANLLDNSAKYTDRGGRIWLKAERQGSDVVVKVGDNGSGIPSEMLPHIFESFTLVDRSLERPQSGLGIGLSIVRTLVEMHGGVVEARSEGRGRGSEFVVRLPVALTRVPSSAPVAAMRERAAPVVARRILVVDDNRDSASSLAILLQLMTHDVRAAHDGLEALATAADYRPEVVLLDIGLPKLNGYDVARRLREQPWGKELVLIAVTGWGQDADRERASAAGFDLHLVKPIDAAALEKALGSLPVERARHATGR